MSKSEIEKYVARVASPAMLDDMTHTVKVVKLIFLGGTKIGNDELLRLSADTATRALRHIIKTSG